MKHLAALSSSILATVALFSCGDTGSSDPVIPGVDNTGTSTAAATTTGTGGTTTTTTTTGTGGTTTTTTTTGTGGTTTTGTGGTTTTGTGGMPVTTTGTGGMPVTTTGTGGMPVTTTGTGGMPDVTTTMGGGSGPDVSMGGTMNGNGGTAAGGTGMDLGNAGAPDMGNTGGTMDTGPMCGNGMVEDGEECDPPGDGCEADCTSTPATEEVSIESIVPDLDGHLITTPCGDQPTGDDCAGAGWIANGANIVGCQGGRLEAVLNYDVGGTAGTVYDVGMHFYGVMEPRQYAGAQREAQGRPSLNAGGTPTPWATRDPGGDYQSQGDNNYNTYEIHVFDNNGTEIKQYFLNADSQTGHYTMGINYAKTIQVIGGGSVRLRVFDNNCRQIKNCGPNGGAPCSGKAVSIDISGADPQPGNLLQQPGLGQAADHSGQWWLIDVTSVAVAE